MVICTDDTWSRFLVDELVDFVVQFAGRFEVVPERLLHHHARVLGEARLGEALDDPPEQERWDLEVEHGAARLAQDAGEMLVGGGVAEVAVHIGEPRGEALEHLVVDVLPACLDGVVGVLTKIVD
jgi:hypothetical protein